ncbi:MAG: gas vesicle protein [Chloroflexi bacterium]|nr:gas vesicle protein [Chloroflexota bacterium]
MALQFEKNSLGSLAEIIDRILDKGLIINADIKVNLVGVELLDIRIRAAVASFETAARYGLEFPSGTKLPNWAGNNEASLSSQADVEHVTALAN